MGSSSATKTSVIPLDLDNNSGLCARIFEIGRKKPFQKAGHPEILGRFAHQFLATCNHLRNSSGNARH